MELNIMTDVIMSDFLCYEPIPVRRHALSGHEIAVDMTSDEPSGDWGIYHL